MSGSHNSANEALPVFHVQLLSFDHIVLVNNLAFLLLFSETKILWVAGQATELSTKGTSSHCSGLAPSPPHPPPETTGRRYDYWKRF